MLVTKPISAVSSCAINAAPKAIPIANTVTNSTRLSTSVDLRGMRAACSDGESDGATGSASVEPSVRTLSCSGGREWSLKVFPFRTAAQGRGERRDFTVRSRETEGPGSKREGRDGWRKTRDAGAWIQTSTRVSD